MNFETTSAITDEKKKCNKMEKGRWKGFRDAWRGGSGKDMRGRVGRTMTGKKHE